MGLGDFFFGNSSQPGMLGTGQFHADLYQPDKSSFSNPASGTYQQYAMDNANGAQGRAAPMSSAATVGDADRMSAATTGPASLYGGATLDQTAANESRGFQTGLMSQLSDEASGKGPSLAGMQLNAGMQQNLANQLSAAASGVGNSNPALAQRNLAMQGAQLGQQTTQQAAIMRMQEQQAAQNQLAGLSTNVRGQDIGAAGQNAGFAQQAGLFNAGAQNQFAGMNAGFDQQARMANQNAYNQFALAQAGFNQQTGLANQQAQLGMYGLNDAQQRAMFGAALGVNQSDMSAAMAYEQLKAQQSQAQAQSDQSAYESTRGKGIMELAGIAGGAAMLASDEDGKTDIGGGASDLSTFLKGYSAMGGTGAGTSGAGNLLGSIGKIGDSIKTNNQIADMTSALQDTDINTMKAQLDAKSADVERAIAAQSAATAQKNSFSSPSGSGGGIGSMLGGILGGGGGGGAAEAEGADMALSDEDEKTAKGPAGLDSFLRGVGAHSYVYKDPSAPGAAPGKHFGPMAQELEAAGPVGKSMVVDTPAGKMVDTRRASLVGLSATAMLEKRLDALEAKVGKAKGKAA